MPLQINLNKPNNAINKAYKKQKLARTDIDKLKKELTNLLKAINTKESEENNKNLLITFLKNVFYTPKHKVNTKEGADLVIHVDKDATSAVGVLFETKRPNNLSEMISVRNPNKKALHELLLYYLRERIEHQNTEIKYLIATNIYEWYIFNATDFEKIFYKNIQLKKDYTKWKNKQLSSSSTELFYNSIAKPFIEKLDETLNVTYFNLKDYGKDLEKGNDQKLIPLYKVLSPQHLLKQAFANDSNSLDKVFYAELLHIIGLEEYKEKGKKLIRRLPQDKRNDGALLENAIHILDRKNALRKLKNKHSYGNTDEERFFTIGLQLCITWINRILFLKLLEAQLINYHQNNKDYQFLNSRKITDFDELEELFFDVLAKQPKERHQQIKEKFNYVPYLNSSLFEINPLEDITITIGNLKNKLQLPIHKKTVLKTPLGKKINGEKDSLQYLFEFLDAYDFSADGGEDIQEENKTLINASVLGLIFEKINGYKDGSFFTPGFVTMYMCRQAIRRAVVQKFNKHYRWKVKYDDDLIHLYNKLDSISIQDANKVMNSIKICDPAVGSGHFLVSALNELLAIKSDLKILCDGKGRKLRDCTLSIENDELIVTEEEGNLFEYILHENGNINTEKQRIQQTLFHEKQHIIENCLFGVDINPNSVKICRLRLWIELLKHAYYTPKSNYTELETLPNIDINIKRGNSLISRFKLDESLTAALKKQKLKLADYRNYVQQYKNARDKNERYQLIRLIKDIKENFVQDISQTNRNYLRLQKLKAEYEKKYGKTYATMFENEKLSAAQKKDKKQLQAEIDKRQQIVDNIINSAIYKDAFEWRFEFPEVLDNKGKFMGFDCVIGNPPYGLYNKKQNQKTALKADNLELQLIKNNFPEALGGVVNAARLFYAMGLHISNSDGFVAMIIPFGFLTDTTSAKLRHHIFTHHSFIKIDAFPERDSIKRRVFEDAKMSTAIIITSYKKTNAKFDLGVSYGKNINTQRLKLHFQSIQSINAELLSIPITSNDKFKVLYTIFSKKNIQKIKSIGSCLTGEVDMTFAKNAITSDKNHALLIKGVQIGKYHYKKNNTDISQGKIDYLNLEKFKDIYRGKKLTHSKKKRLILQGLTGVNETHRLKCTIIDKNIFLANSVNYFIEAKISLEYLLALLNSKVLNFIFKCLSTSSNVNGYEVDNLPIIISPKPEPFINKVRQLLTIHTNKTQLENEIDQLVYQLYELTSKEINIIENA